MECFIAWADPDGGRVTKRRRAGFTAFSILGGLLSLYGGFCIATRTGAGGVSGFFFFVLAMGRVYTLAAMPARTYLYSVYSSVNV